MFRLIFASLAAICAAAACLGFEPALAQRPVAPSFDCSKASAAVDVMICHDPALASADALMARLFAAAQVSAFGKGPSDELRAQRAWLKNRSTGCMAQKPDEQSPCLLSSASGRNEELAVATIFANPDLALDTLRRVDPKGAPLIEAVYLYAAQAPHSDWSSPVLASKRQQLLALLQPYVERFATEEDSSYGRDILKDDGIVTAADAIKNAKAFTSFVGVASAYLPDRSAPLSMPCAAFVHNPELIDMEASVFGSTMDNFILVSDCADTLPPTPQFRQLVKQINGHWPKCEGTIRFAAYRNFATTIDKVLLATDADLPPKRPRGTPRLKAIPPQQVRAAIEELKAYYRTYGRASSATAPALAEAMVAALLNAGYQCE